MSFVNGLARILRAVRLNDQEKGSLSTPLCLHWLRFKKMEPLSPFSYFVEKKSDSILSFSN
jgi:hypothetical protein